MSRCPCPYPGLLINHRVPQHEAAESCVLTEDIASCVGIARAAERRTICVVDRLIDVFLMFFDKL